MSRFLITTLAVMTSHLNINVSLFLRVIAAADFAISTLLGSVKRSWLFTQADKESRARLYMIVRTNTNTISGDVKI